jgi:di/tricarboxylate transporter
LGRVGDLLLSVSAKGKIRFFLLLMVTVAVLSAFMNNTPVVVVFLPVVLRVAHSSGIPASKLLMPLSFVSILGGVCTLIGTSVNIVVSDFAAEHGPGKFEMFELTKVGVIAAAVGIVYLLVVGMRLLPVRTTVADAVSGRPTEYLTEVALESGSSLVGKTLGDTLSAPGSGIRVLEVIRESIILVPEPELALEGGDLLLIKGSPDELYNLQQSRRATLVPELEEGGGARAVEASLAEVVITPDSRLNGRRIGDVAFRDRYGVSVFAVQRHGIHIREKLRNIVMRVGDMLLVQGSSEALRKLTSAEAFLLLMGVQSTIQRKHKAPIAVGVGLLTIFLISREILSPEVAALFGASLMVLTRCITIKEAYDSLNLQVLMLLAGMLALGAAMHETGAARFVADRVVGLTADYGPFWALAGIYVTTMLLTEAVTNAATAALMCPIAMSTAAGLEVNAMPFLVAVCFAASFSFITPVGYQTNTLVYGPGGYRFSDYFRVGLPLSLILGTVTLMLIPVFWPF